MKKHYKLTLLLTFASQIIFAQAPIAREQAIPTIGDNGLIDFGIFIDPGSTTGTDQVWDFSSFVSFAQHTYECVDVASTPMGSDYPTALYCVKSWANADPTSIAYNFYAQEGTKEVNLGIHFPQLNLPYTDPQLFLNFPIILGDEVVDTFEGAFEGIFGYTTRAGAANYVVDGHGTLILPYGTYDNVYRVKLELDYSDTYPTGSIDYYNVNYFFIKAGVHWPFAQSVTFVSPDINTTYSLMMNESSINVDPVGIEDLSLSQEAIQIAPNPIMDVATIVLHDENLQNLSLSIFDYTGKEIENISNVDFGSDQSFTHDFSSYAAGIYLVKMDSDKGSVVKKIVIQ